MRMLLVHAGARRSRRPRVLLAAGLLAIGVAAAGCVPPPPAPPPDAPVDAPPAPSPGGPAVCDPPVGSTATSVPVMGPCPRLTVEQIVAWFNAKTRPTYRASVPITDLVTMFVEEGQAEGVRGDLAFVQAILETGWFSFAGQVPPQANNFAGIGATDGTTSYATFADARTGVRAQIQHLRAYADATATTCAVPPLHNPCVDPRFALVSPKGKAPTWNQFGNGVWASSTTYATSILNLYAELLATRSLTLA